MNNAAAIYADVGGKVYVGTNSYQGTASIGVLEAIYTGFLEVVGLQTNNMTSSPYWMYTVFGGSIVDASNTTHVFNTTVTYTDFVNADAQSRIIFPGGPSFTGAGATSSLGPAYSVTNNSYLTTAGHTGHGGGTSLIGSTAGTATTGGIVV